MVSSLQGRAAGQTGFTEQRAYLGVSREAEPRAVPEEGPGFICAVPKIRARDPTDMERALLVCEEFPNPIKLNYQD